MQRLVKLSTSSCMLINIKYAKRPRDGNLKPRRPINATTNMQTACMQMPVILRNLVHMPSHDQSSHSIPYIP
jgi:hypothetical protein